MGAPVSRKTKAALFTAGLTALLIALAIWLRRILIPFVLGIVLAYLITPAVGRLTRLGVYKWMAIILIYVYAGVVVGLAVFLCVPVFIEQLLAMLELLPQWLAAANDRFQALLAALEAASAPDFVIEAVRSLGDGLQPLLQEKLSGLRAGLSRLISTALYVVLGPILAFYVVRDHKAALARLEALFPPRELPEIRRLAGDMDHLARQFVNGYLVVSLLIAILSALFYAAVGLRYSLVLGVVMGLTDLIPYFGPFLGAIPALIVAAGEGTGTFVLVGLGILVLQQVESSVIAPKIMGDRIGMHPLAIILAVLAGGALLGVLGAILAVPLTAALLLLIKYLYGRFVGVDTEKFAEQDGDPR